VRGICLFLVRTPGDGARAQKRLKNLNFRAASRRCKVDAFASDDILLYGFIASHSDGRRYGVVGDFLSYEPHAITLFRDDSAFADLIRSNFARMASEGTLTGLYTQWLVGKLPNGERLNIPMSPHLAEMYRAIGQPD
jgi:glutamate/aspartate transport system substrate-binding protein